jgi:hypothetical protein
MDAQSTALRCRRGSPAWRRLRSLFVVSWLAGVGAMCLAQADSPAAAGDGASSVSDGELATAFVGFVLVPLLFWRVRKRLIGHVASQMMAVSSEQRDETIDELAAGEVQSRSTPRWDIQEADSSTPESIAPRQRHEQGALALLRRLTLADAGFGAAYLLAAAAGAAAAADGARWSLGILIGIVLIVAAAIRYLLLRRQFRAFDLSRSRARQRLYDRMKRVWAWILGLVSIASGTTASNLLELPAVLRAVFGLRARLLFAVAVIGASLVAAAASLADGGPAVAAVSLMIAAALHAAGSWMLAQRMSRLEGVRLLVLRVFDIDATSAFTFSGLMAYWRHFGNHFTIVDTSFLRQRNEAGSTATALWCFVFWGALALASVGVIGGVQRLVGAPLTWHWMIPIVVLLALGGAGLLLAIGTWRLDRQFLRSHDQLLARLRRLDLHPRQFDLAFRHEQVMCHDNTWFPAVAEFARRADVVMMDLRGYGEQRKGCQREVDFLFDAVPLDRLLFLVDSQDDHDVVAAMLLQRWERLRKTSPNLELAAPVIHVYMTRDNDRRDMQGILDRLVNVADTQGHRALAAASARAAAPTALAA